MTRHPSPEDLPPPLELECLTVLWRLRAANVKEVREALLPARPLAYTTVMTLLDRLAKRGLVEREKQGRSFRYQPTIEREILQRTAVLQLADRLFDGSFEELRRFLGIDSLPAPLSQPSASRHADNLDAALL
ncbi:MAG: BlaI/MecI/CopY family transcriptional regulator [Bryobacterales bacterium]|nr:BlaI/MecI/CopY family transcriptional regulator [Bryobacterales bacterium]